jgi:energy-converting hydrogenase B subunit D
VTGAVQAAAMLLVAILGLLVVLNRDPLRQVVVVGLFGSSLAILFLILQAPDVALSQVVVGVAYPLMVLLTLSRAREHRRR